MSADRASGDFFEAVLALHDDPPSVANFMNNALQSRLPEDGYPALPFGSGEFAELVALVDEGAISNNIAKEILDLMMVSGGDPRQIMVDRGLQQISDDDACWFDNLGVYRLRP